MPGQSQSHCGSADAMLPMPIFLPGSLAGQSIVSEFWNQKVSLSCAHILLTVDIAMSRNETLSPNFYSSKYAVASLVKIRPDASYRTIVHHASLS
jgi:hypothetical protein